MGDVRDSEARAGDRSADTLPWLRLRVLRGALTVLALAVPGISLVIVLANLHSKFLGAGTVLLALYTLSFPALRFLHTRLGPRVSSITLLALLALTAFLVELRGGAGPGNILLNALVVLLGTLFFGRRGAAIGLGLVVALFALAGALVLGDVVPPIPTMMWDPNTVAFWVRGTFATALVGLAIAVAQVFIVERLVTEANRLARLVEHEQQQRAALETAQREHERERDQRMQAQRALEESQRVEALARMAGGIAHDFNNALTVVIGAAEEIGYASSLPSAKERAREVVDAARGTAELTRQLLMLGRRQVSRPQPVGMTVLCERLRGAFRRILPDDVVLDFPAPASELAVQVDPTDLERALLNLVLNARDAMPNGGRLQILVGEREVGEDATLAPGRYVEITVTDTGEGIPPEIVGRIFEPFFTTKPVEQGTGLGLPTVYAFAQNAGGHLRVDSRPDASTTFTLLLPVTHAEARVSERPAASPAPPPAHQAHAPVLVVEDNPIVRANMVKALRDGGFDVTAAEDGDAAMARLDERSDFAVLCIDGVMPGAATRDVIARAEHDCRTLKVLLCSGHLPEDLLRRGVAAGRYAFLPKPFSSSDLVGVVRSLVGA